MSNRGSPSIAVGISTLNAEAHVRACLAAVLSQTHPATEILVADGGSTDSTVEIVRSVGAGRVRLLVGPDSGIYDAWNRILRVVTSEWILFLGADDVLATPDVFARACRRLEAAEPRHRLVYGSIDLVDRDGSSLGHLGAPWEKAKLEIAGGMPIPNPAAFYHTSLFHQFGLFDDTFSYSGDYEFFLRVFKVASPTFLEGPPLIRMGAHGLTSEARTPRRRYLEDHRARQMHHVFRNEIRRWADRCKVELRFLVRLVLGPRLSLRLANASRHATGRPLLPNLPKP